MILGTGITFNCDDDTAKQVLEEFYKNTNFYTKLHNVVDGAIIGGLGLFVKTVDKETGEITGIEDFDMPSILRIHRDKFGNPQKYVQRFPNTGLITHQNVQDFVRVVLKRNGRNVFGQSMFESLAVPQVATNGTYEPLIERYLKVLNAMHGAVINFGHPLTFIETKAGQTKEQKRKFIEKLATRKPGELFVTDKSPEIHTAATDMHNTYDVFVEKINQDVAHGTGFPLEILQGDFTSKASSLTTDSIFMRKIHTYREMLARTLIEDIFEPILIRHLSKRWDSPEKRKDMNLSITFNTDVPTKFTPEQVLARVQAGIWTISEAREYDKNEGQDLFDDKVIDSQQEQRELDNKMENTLKLQESKQNIDKSKVNTKMLQLTAGL